MGYYPKVETEIVPLSFETDQQAQIDVRFGSRVQVLRAKSTVTKALAGTDAGTVTFKDEANATLLTLSHALSAAIEVTASGSFPAATIVEKDQHLKLDPAKTTAGGEVTVEIEYQAIGT